MKIKQILKECYNKTEEEAQEIMENYKYFRFPDNRKFRKKLIEITN